MLISVIIPALNEAAHLAATIRSAQSDSTAEVIVVDGGSRDATAAIAQASGAQVICTAAGRATQMNAGARAARSEIFLFLHADTRLPLHFDRYVFAALAQEKAVAGAFRLGLDGAQVGLRWVETIANWRARWAQLPYGDQAIFMPSEIFARLGGFPALPLMEDFELMRRLRQHGRIVLAPVAVVSSARRWLKLGIIKTTAINQILIAAYLGGVAPARLARWYGQNTGLTPAHDTEANANSAEKTTIK